MASSLLRSSLLLLLAAFLAATSASLQWVSVSPFSEADVPLLHEQGVDFRGRFDNMALLVLSPAQFSQVSSMFSQATVAKIAPFHEDQPLVYLEYVELENPSITVEQWLSTVETIVAVENLDLIISQKSRVFLHLRNPLEHIKVTFPEVTDIVTVATRPIVPVALATRQHLKALKDNIPKTRDAISDLLSLVDENRLRFWTEYLTGESRLSRWTSRNSFSDEVIEACDWAKSQFENYGFNVSIEYFQSPYGPNVIATKLGSVDPDEYVVVGAHIDSREVDRNSATNPAPGANDDGSGTAILLETARVIADSGIEFKKSIILGAWNGEEQGLVGSRAYAAKCREEGLNIIAMLQGDMLAFRREGENFQCAFPDRVQTPELTELAMEVVNTYVPEVETCYTPACCSDHQSFIENGFPATQFFERCGSIADDQYHRSGDLLNRNGFDMEQLYLNAKAMIANAATVAEPL